MFFSLTTLTMCFAIDDDDSDSGGGSSSSIIGGSHIWLCYYYAQDNCNKGHGHFLAYEYFNFQ